MKKIFQVPIYRFLIFAILLYVLWFLAYDIWLHPLGILDDIFKKNLVFMGEAILHIMGYDLIDFTGRDSEIEAIGIDGTHGLWVGDPCNGITLIALFAGFIIAFPGPWKSKAWFIPLGMLAIHLLNIARVVGLCLIVLYAPEYLEFNHNYVFTTVVYSLIFLMWYFWVSKYSTIGKDNLEKDNENEVGTGI